MMRSGNITRFPSGDDLLTSLTNGRCLPSFLNDDRWSVTSDEMIDPSKSRTRLARSAFGVW